MKEVYKNCQSCGMPLKKDPQGGGSEKNGDKSTMYCSHCYASGEFIVKDITSDEMKNFVKAKLVEIGMPRFIASFFTRNIHKLKRWSS